jgi:cell division protein FtsB
MKDNVQNQQNSKNSTVKKWMLALGILLLLALIFLIVLIFRGGRLNSENQNLQNEKTVLTEKNQQLLDEKNTYQKEVSVLEVEIDTLKTRFERQLAQKEARLSSLRNQSYNLAQLRSRIAEYKKMEGEFEDLKNQHSMLQADEDSLKNQIESLLAKVESLKDTIDGSRGLRAYNIYPLTKWDRWLWADRYNISRARRVDETTITFAIAGTLFTENGNRMVYLRLIDPAGSLLYPSEDSFETDETGTQKFYTKAKEIEFTGEDLPMTFNVEHEDDLEPGKYEIEIYIDGKLTKSGQMNLE